MHSVLEESAVLQEIRGGVYVNTPVSHGVVFEIPKNFDALTVP